MRPPMDRYAFGKFIEESDIFRLTRDAMECCLRNWYHDERAQFVHDMRADLKTVMEPYHFYNRMVSFNKNFEFDMPLDTITCMITINDEEDDDCASYLATFDYDLDIIDDSLER